MITSLLLTGSMMVSGYNYRPNRALNHRQVRAKAMLIVQRLKKEDPKVLRSVMYYMGWVPKMEYKKEKCKKTFNQRKSIDDYNQWELDMLMDMGGLKNPRGK